MAIYAYTGLPGSGKTTKLAELLLSRLKEARRIDKSVGYKRKVRTNISLSPLIVKEFQEYIEFFDDIYTMPLWKDCDVFIDELSTYFDAQEWERLPRNIKRYLRLHRHYRVNIYGIAQDFNTIDKSFRRLTNDLFHMVRVFGTKEPVPWKKASKMPFVFSIQYAVDRKFWEFEKEMYQYIGSTYHLFTKSTFQIFDTAQELPEQLPPPLKKVTRTCPEDGFKQVRYI